MHVHGQDARGPYVERRQWEQCVTQETGPAERRPWNGALIGACLCSIALQCLSSPVQSQGDAAGDVGEQRQRDHQRLGKRGLVVRPCEEEVSVCFGHRAGD